MIFFLWIKQRERSLYFSNQFVDMISFHPHIGINSLLLGHGLASCIEPGLVDAKKQRLGTSGEEER